MKVMLFANTDWYLYNFRLGLINSLAKAGAQICLVCPPGPYADRLSAFGYQILALHIEGRSTNPIANLGVYLTIRKLIKKEKPDVLHAFTIKCVIFGGLAARSLDVARIHAVTGLGHLFQNQGWSMRGLRPFIKWLYRLASGGKRVYLIFQNEEDQTYLEDAGIIRPGRSIVIRGSGADCERFTPTSRRKYHGPCRVLFASRLLREKGVFELIEACRQLRSRGLDFELLLAGTIFPGTADSLTAQDLETFEASGLGRLLGHVEDMPNCFAQADIVALPSYHEGTPRVLIEAAASGLPLVATDIAGCRGVVQPGRNGELVPVGVVDALADALEKLIRDPTMRATYGKESRAIVESGFCEAQVVDRTLSVYRRLLQWPPMVQTK